MFKKRAGLRLFLGECVQCAANRLRNVMKLSGRRQTGYLPLSAVTLADCSGDSYVKNPVFREARATLNPRLHFISPFAS